MIDEAQKNFPGWEEDRPDMPIEKRVLRLTRDLYYSEVLTSDKPWFISFVKTKKAQEQFWHSEFVNFACRVLADEYEGQVRFAYVDILSDEVLKETFGVITVPQSFWIQNGTATETPSFFMSYEQIKHMIDNKQYNNMTFMYQQFAQPSYIFDQNTIYLKYIYNEGFKQYYAFYNWFTAYNMEH